MGKTANSAKNENEAPRATRLARYGKTYFTNKYKAKIPSRA